MKIILAIILMICASCTVPALSMAQSANNAGWDILGVRIGNTIEEATAGLKANLPEVTIRPQKGTIRQMGFESPPMIFGVEAFADSDAGSSQQKITMVCDTLSPGKIIALRLVSNFSRHKPSFDSTSKSLIEKYGTPDIITNSGYDYYWLKEASEKYKDPQNISKIRNLANIVFNMATGHFMGDRFDGSGGTILNCVMHIFSLSGSELVSNLEISLMDLGRLSNSSEHVRKLLNEGDEAVVNKEKAKGDKVKPKF